MKVEVCPRCGRNLAIVIDEEVTFTEPPEWWDPFLPYEPHVLMSTREVCFNCGWINEVLNLADA